MDACLGTHNIDIKYIKRVYHIMHIYLFLVQSDDEALPSKKCIITKPRPYVRVLSFSLILPHNTALSRPSATGTTSQSQTRLLKKTPHTSII